MASKYAPVVTDVRMSDYGYWIVTLSLSPGYRMSCMIAVTGITPEQASELAVAGVILPPVPGGR